MNANINIYFNYLLAKTSRENGHHTASNITVKRVLISENIIDTFVFVLEKAVRLLCQAVF